MILESILDLVVSSLFDPILGVRPFRLVQGICPFDLIRGVCLFDLVIS